MRRRSPVTGSTTPTACWRPRSAWPTSASWYHGRQGRHTPWGDEDTPALVTAVETALERELSTHIMRSGAKPAIRALKQGDTLTEQGAVGAELYLLLDGVLAVEVGGDVVAEVGPGAVVGERAALEGGIRTSTLRALTPARVAVARSDQLTDEARAELGARPPQGGAGAGAGRRRTRPGQVRLALLGVRGSTPALGPEFTATGGNTACVALSHDGCPPSLVLDAGTGLRRLSARLGGAAFRGSILLSHLHWDHVQGLPFFTAGDRDDAIVQLFMPEQGDPIGVLSRAMSPPHFPIGPEGLRGSWGFAGMAPGCHRIEGFDVLALDIAHKGGRTFGYRIEDGRGSIAYLPDHALWLGTGGRSEADTANVRELVTGVDVLIHDAQFLEAERHVAVAYGHSTIEAAMALAESARWAGSSCSTTGRTVPMPSWSG